MARQQPAFAALGNAVFALTSAAETAIFEAVFPLICSAKTSIWVGDKSETCPYLITPL